MTTIFKPGDRVKCAFYGDEVFTLSGTQEPKYLSLYNPSGQRCLFLCDGRFNETHTHPVLTLVEAKREPVRIECKAGFVVSNGEVVLRRYDTINWDVSRVGLVGTLTFIEATESEGI